MQHVESKVYAAVKIVPQTRPLSSPNPTTSDDEQQHKDERKRDVVADEGLAQLERELALMKLVSHPNLLSLLDIWESSREM